MPPAFAIDADAFCFLHALGLLEHVAKLASDGSLVLHVTGYVATFEMKSLELRVQQLQAAGALKVHKIRSRTNAFNDFRRLRESGRTRSGLPVHKGECELVAWLMNEGDGVALVSCDEGARTLAQEQKIDALDLCDFTCELVRLRLLPETMAAEYLAVWEDPHANRGRPASYQGFETALAQWVQRFPSSS